MNIHLEALSNNLIMKKSFVSLLHLGQVINEKEKKFNPIIPITITVTVHRQLVLKYYFILVILKTEM